MLNSYSFRLHCLSQWKATNALYCKIILFIFHLCESPLDFIVLLVAIQHFTVILFWRVEWMVAIDHHVSSVTQRGHGKRAFHFTSGGGQGLGSQWKSAGSTVHLRSSLGLQEQSYLMAATHTHTRTHNRNFHSGSQNITYSSWRKINYLKSCLLILNMSIISCNKCLKQSVTLVKGIWNEIFLFHLTTWYTWRE